MRALRAAYEAEREFVKYVDGVLRPTATDWSPPLFRIESQPRQWPAFDRVTASPGGTTCTSMTYRLHPTLGVTASLLDWLVDEGRTLGCSQLHLDSGTGTERFDAHRLYYNHGLAIYSHHFARGL